MRRLFEKEKGQLQQPAYRQNKQEEQVDDSMLNKHSLNRVKKKINDFIIMNYNSLFFQDPAVTVVTRSDIFSHPKLMQKALEELRLCTEQRTPLDLLKECITELEDKGFLNLLEQTAD